MNSKTRKQVKHFNDPGHIHFLTFSCLNRWPLLLNKRSIQWFLDSLFKTCREWEYELWCYTVMPNHVHLIVRPLKDEYKISKFLQAVKQPVARKANKWLSVHSLVWKERLTVVRASGKREFHFWQAGGGYDRNLVSEKSVRKTIDYIHDNPVRKGFVRNASEWKWSSARWFEENGKLGIDLDGE